MKAIVAILLVLAACSSSSAEVYLGCTETCDGICTCPPEYQACVATCGSHGVKHCMPAGALNEEGCLAYSNAMCIDDVCRTSF